MSPCTFVCTYMYVKAWRIMDGGEQQNGGCQVTLEQVGI